MHRIEYKQISMISIIFSPSTSRDMALTLQIRSIGTAAITLFSMLHFSRVGFGYQRTPVLLNGPAKADGKRNILHFLSQNSAYYSTRANWDQLTDSIIAIAYNHAH